MCTNIRLFFGKLALAALVSASGILAGANAANVTWTGSAADNDFNNSANWAGGAINGNTLVFNSSTLPVAGALTLSATGNSTPASNGNSIVFNTGTTAYTITGGTLTMGNNSFILNNSALTQTVKTTLDIGANNRMLVNNSASRGTVALGRVIMGNNATLSAASEWNSYGLQGATLMVDELDFGANGIVLQGRQVSSVLYRPDYADLPSLTIGNLNGTGRVNANSNLWNTLTITGSATPGAAAGTQLNMSANMRLVLDYTSGDASRLGGRQLAGNVSDTVVLRGGSAAAGEVGQLYTVGRTRLERDGGAATYMATWIGYDANWRGVYDVAESGLLGYNGTDNTYINYSTGNGDSNAIAPWVTIGADNSAGRDFAKRGAGNLYVALEAADYTNVLATTWSNTINGVLAGGYSNASIRVGNLKITGDPGSGALADNTLQIQDAGALQMITGGMIFTGTSDYLITGGKIGINWGGALYVWQSGQGTLTISSTITGPMSAFVKAGAGTLVLNADNGAIVDQGFRANPRISILDGTLVVGHDHALGRADSNLTVSGTLDLNGHNVTIQSMGGGAYYGAALTNSAAQQATLTVTSSNNSAGNIGYGFFQYGNISGDTRVILDLAGIDATFNINVANTFTGGIEFRNNVAASDGSANLFTRRGSINNTRIYHYQAFGTGSVTLSGSATVLSLSMGNDGNNIGVANDFVISGTHMIGLDSAVKFNGAWHAGADDVALITNNFTGGYATLNGNMTDFSGTIYAWLNSPRDSRLRQHALILNPAGANLSNASVVLAQSGSGNDAATQYNYFVTHLNLSAPGTYQVGGLASAYIDNNPGAGGAQTPYMNAGGDVFVRAQGGNGAYLLEIGARGNDNDIFDGHITNYATINQSGNYFANWTDTDTNHPVSINKVGTGTLALTNLNTYTGSTTVSGGVLLLSGAADLSRTGAVTVSGGTLALSGNARISSGNATQINVSNGVLLDDTTTGALDAKQLKLNAGGVLGGSGVIGTEEIYFNGLGAGLTGGGLGTTGTLTLSGDYMWEKFTYYFDILSNSAHDLLNFTGAGLDLELGGPASFTLNVNNLGGLSEFNDVTIISGLNLSYFGDPNDVLGLWSLPSDEYTLSLNGNDLLLSYAQQIPEPSTWLLLSLGSATLLLTLRRRK